MSHKKRASCNLVNALDIITPQCYNVINSNERIIKRIIMNYNLMERVKKLGVSQYKLSRETGVPYTTISRLERGTMDINNCSAEVVHRLSLYLGCTIEDIINPVAYLHGIKGTHRGYSYYWKINDGQDILIIEKDGEKIIREYGKPKTNRRYYESSKAFAEIEIDLYIRKKEAARICGITD